MSVVDLGGLTVGAAAPGAASAVVAGSGGITAALPDLQAQLAALLAFSPQLINFTTSISIAVNIIAQLNAAITAGVVPPNFATQIAMASAQVAALVVQIGGINAQLSVLTALQAPLAVSGLHGYAFTGDAADAGAELGAAITGNFAGPVQVLALATGSPTTWSALGAIMKTS